ncbi:MAG: hypothetical protein MUC52_01015, partial [Candidatus Omnitrophica bacterium]|nr:hypothetical protein [Candidatus Omnitrophota bacterium]
FIGKERIARDLANAVADKSPAPSAEAAAKPLPAADLVKHFLSFTPGIIVSAGLVDGINPCAFTVIIFFISFLALQGYSRRDTALIGASFILAVFLTYLLLGLGLFGFFYSIKGVMLVRKAFNWIIAAFTLILGILAVRDIMQFRKTRSTDNMILALPASVKNQIHKVIGLGYRRRQTEGNDAAGRPVTAILLTAFVTGFLVSLLEAVCTGQLYLPTISYVLKSSGMKLQAAWYLVLYNLMFVTPLIVIFLCALAGVNSGEFSKFFHRHFVLTKSLLAIMFFVLAVFLIWRG